MNARDDLPIGGPVTVCTQCGLRARSPIIKGIGNRQDGQAFGECTNKAACQKRQARTKQKLAEGKYEHA